MPIIQPSADYATSHGMPTQQKGGIR